MKRFKKNYSVDEGATGVLYLTDDLGGVEIFQPNCCLEKTQEYLYMYHELEVNINKTIKKSFVVSEIDWYPSSVSALYWNFFFQYVKYESLIEKWRRGEIKFKHVSPGRFNNLLHSLGYEKEGEKENITNFIRKSVSRLVNIRNRVLIRPNKNGLLFLRQSLDDFRTNEILENLNLNFSVVQLVPLSKLKLKHIFFDSSLCVLPISHYIDMPGNFTDIKLSKGSPRVFHCALEYTKKIIAKHFAMHQMFDKYLSGTSFCALIGLDDCNYPYPFIYSAQNNGIKTIGIQHGAYTRRHEAYVMRNISNHRWYDYLIVWGEFWKEEFLKNNKIFNPERVFLSENKHRYQYAKLPKRKSLKSILIPYEFLADTILIGDFIRIFYEKGFAVYFKPRNDQSIAEQIKSYELGSIANELKIVNEITLELMSNIDIVAGTMTTLLYDLLPYGKPIWILDTPFKLQNDMVKNGLARLILWSDMDKIDKIYNHDLAKNIKINEKYFSYGKSASNVIFDIVSKKK